MCCSTDLKRCALSYPLDNVPLRHTNPLPEEHNPAMPFLPGRPLATCDFNHIKTSTRNHLWILLMSDVCQNINKSVQALIHAASCPRDIVLQFQQSTSEDTAGSTGISRWTLLQTGGSADASDTRREERLIVFSPLSLLKIIN